MSNRQRRLEGAQEPRQAVRERPRGLTAPDENRLGDRETGNTGSHAATAVGSVDMDAIFRRCEKVQQVNKQYKTYIKAEQERLTNLEGQIKKPVAQLQRLAPGSPDFLALEGQTAALKNQYETERETLQREATQRQARTAAVLYKEIQGVITSVAKAKGLSYVVKVSPEPQPDSELNEVMTAVNHSVVYADPENDLTEEVIHDLNRRFKDAEAKTPR